MRRLATLYFIIRSRPSYQKGAAGEKREKNFAQLLLLQGAAGCCTNRESNPGAKISSFFLFRCDILAELPLLAGKRWTHIVLLDL